MQKQLRNWGLLAVWLLPEVAFGALGFAPILNDGAVLQCEMPATVWGNATAGAEVEVRLDGRPLAKSVANTGGKWMVALPAQAPGGPHVIEVAAGSETTKLNDVYFGEVWLASGQSNMQWPLAGAHGGEEFAHSTIPEIRFVNVPLKTGLPVEGEFTAKQLAWQSFQPGSHNKVFAVAFFFAQKLQPVVGRRIGVIQSAIGGTPCEAWTPLQALEQVPALSPMAQTIRKGMANKTAAEWKNERDAYVEKYRKYAQWTKDRQGPEPENPKPPGPENPWSEKSPGVLYANMIEPLVPYTTRGVIWYQGEGNAGKPDEYRILFPAMIHAWRAAWNRPDWPFLFVQISGFSKIPGDSWPQLRAAQVWTRDTVPNTGMAVAIDCGEKMDIHPKAKQPVGERLALLALNQVYGQNLAARSPLLKAAIGLPEGKVRVVFEHYAEGLKSSDGNVEIPGFELAGTDGKFQPASARIAALNALEVESATVPQPVAVRYAWVNWPEPPVTLQNSAGLPAEPFSSVLQSKASKRAP
jgi:sialate O-acetylesterase